MKRLAIFLTIVMMVAAMSGCMRSGQERTPEKPASVTVSEEPIKEPSGSQVGTAEVSGMAEATPEPSTGTTPPNGGDTTPTTTPEPEVDPSENLVISESTANSLMIHCLKQNGKVYNLSKGATLADSERNNYGFRVTMAATLRYIYYECEGIDGNSIGDISIGDITPPVFTPTVGTGALEFYAPSSISPMYTQAWKAEFVGYTVAVIDLRDDTSGGIIVPDFKSGTPEAIT